MKTLAKLFMQFFSKFFSETEQVKIAPIEAKTLFSDGGVQKQKGLQRNAGLKFFQRQKASLQKNFKKLNSNKNLKP